MDEVTKNQIINAANNGAFNNAAQNTITFGEIQATLKQGNNLYGPLENQPWTITWSGNGQNGTISRDTNGNISGGRRRRRRRTRRSRGSKKRSSRRHRRSRRHR